MNRRELLGDFGIASASTLLWALGCGGATPKARQPIEITGEVRGWLRDAVTRLAVLFPSVHVLAVTRRRTTAAVDVLGTGVARHRRDGVVITVRDRNNRWREQVTSDLDEAGVGAAVRALVGTSTKRASIGFPPRPPQIAPPRLPSDAKLKVIVRDLDADDRVANSRVVYRAAMIDIDDAIVWSISTDHDREQRLLRVRKRVTRAAWNGTRPVVSEIERGWMGNVEGLHLTRADVESASAAALMLVTPGTFSDGERTVVLDPSVAAALVDAGTRTLLTTTAARRPEVSRRLTLGATVASPMLTLIDDPTSPAAYGGFAFDDHGTPARPLALIEAGKLAAVLDDAVAKGRGRRPGHVGAIEAAPSHLRVVPGAARVEALREDGLILEGGHSAIVDPSTDRVVIGVSRARELKAGTDTGRVWADVELVGSMAALLANITGVSSEPIAVPFRDDHDNEPRWRSIEVPHMRITKAFVRARRRRA